MWPRPSLSLTNVLRLQPACRLVDEAHMCAAAFHSNAASFNPSLHYRVHRHAGHGKSPSNVLHSVSAAQLQAEDMIKMPMPARDALQLARGLGRCHRRAQSVVGCGAFGTAETSEYFRPIMAHPAQPKHKDRETITLMRSSDV